MKIFVGRAIHDAGLKLLREAGYDVVVNDGPPLSPEQLRQSVRDCDALISVPPDKIDSALLDVAPNLRIVQNYSVGVDNIDLAECAARNVPVGNTPDVLTDATADVAWALLMAAAWRVVEADAFVRRGDWRGWEPKDFWGADFNGATLGIVGFGRIGQAVARRAQGFGLKVLYWNRSEREEALELSATRVELDVLLKQSDFVSVHCALTPDTRELLGERELGLMKPSAILVNTARGAVIDQSALAAALKHRTIRGAGLDVFEKEPLPLSDELTQLPNVVLTPHYGSATERTRAAMSRLCGENVLAALRGDAIPHLVK
ncbi:MAG TPA: D-glycerate dehydrogenase [Abditibacteriaceae bacterium]|jgi:glyoxylate reductase